RNDSIKSDRRDHRCQDTKRDESTRAQSPTLCVRIEPRCYRENVTEWRRGRSCSNSSAYGPDQCLRVARCASKQKAIDNSASERGLLEWNEIPEHGTLVVDGAMRVADDSHDLHA